MGEADDLCRVRALDTERFPFGGAFVPVGMGGGGGAVFPLDVAAEFGTGRRP